MPGDRENIHLKLEQLRGDVKALNEVVRMSMAEQKRINEQVSRLLESHQMKIESLEKKQYYFSGVIATLVVVWEWFKTSFGGK